MKRSANPPIFAHFLLRRLCLYEEDHSILGDFEETYVRMLRREGVLKAWFWYWLQALRTLPEYLKLKFTMRTIMLKNYIIVAFRNIKKSRSFAFINVSGFAVGLASCILILLYIRYELSYDKFYHNVDNIYRIAMEELDPDRPRYWGWTSVMLSETLHAEYPEVLKATRILTEMGETQITYQNNSNIEKRVLYADSAFFDIFSIPLIVGDPKTVLQHPNSVVISKSTVNRIFGNEDPIGKAIQVRNWWADNTDHLITGISEDIPGNSHFRYDFLISYNSTRVSQSRNFGYTQIFNYLMLGLGSDPDALEAKFPDMVRKYEAPGVEERRQISYDEYLAQGYGIRLFLQPLKDIHLRSRLEQEIEPNGNIAYVYMFSLIAVFVLLIACINFMNLSTARSVNRAKEVGVRKTLGSLRNQLVWQFLFESILLSLIALVMALSIVGLVLPIFRTFTGTDLRMGLWEDGFILPGLILFAVFVGLLSGIYPSFFLSSFKPISVLKGLKRSDSRGKWIRNGLVVFQFGTSIALIAGTLIIKEQIDYMVNMDLGYDREHVIVLSNGSALGDKTETFKQELKKDPRIISVGGSGQYPARANHVVGIYSREHGPERRILIFNTGIDYDYIETLKLEMAMGRSYSREMAMDTATAIINESAVRALGLTDPLGVVLESWRTLTIIGILKDFHFRTLHYDVAPLILILNRSGRVRFLSIRIRSSDISGTLSHIRQVWEQFAGGQPFNYSFMEEDIERLYAAEIKTGQISSVFSFLAIFIGCLGLFGLAAYTAEDRTKEIGIRKVLGASIGNVLVLLSREFAKLIMYAFCAAVPITYLVMNQWLDNFKFKIGITAMTFLIAGGMTLLIALLTVSYQVIRAASRNPVETLKYE